MAKHHMSIDLETRSSADITKTGSYKYLQDPDFRILLFGYKIDDGPEEVIDLTKGDGRIPDSLVRLLADPEYMKHAYNASFEWYALNRAGYPTPLDQWQCTMVHGLYCGYAAGLANTGEAIGLPEDRKKLMAGKALIRYFCTPQKATKTFKKRYHDPEDDPDKWQLFIEYNRQDVVAEWEILQRLSFFPVPASEWDLWRTDVRMNAYGVRVDTALIDGALWINEKSTDDLIEEAVRITGLDNPNSTAQLLPWLAAHGCELENLQKLTVEEALQGDLDPDVRRTLELRQLLGKTSIKKYVAMDTAKCDDDRVRGISQFYGANRTGRFAGRLVQMQNLPRNYLSTLDAARRMVRAENYEGLRMIYGNVPDTLSQLIRTAFIPSEGRHFVVADFSAIEARVIAWLAGEQWVMDVFANNRDIYCETASAMFGVPVEKHGVNSELRQKGKIATLALGYQGSVSAMVAMGALRMGIPEEDLPDIVTRWRESHPKTVGFWYRVERAAVQVVSSGYNRVLPIAGGKAELVFRLENELIYGQSFLTIELPSGRKLFYPKPYLKENDFGKQAVHYYGVKQVTGKWGSESTYGGKLAENCLAEDTLVITDHGPVPIQSVTENMRLWDGEYWVRHEGVILKGMQQTIEVDGVRMTPEHLIHTAEGWKRADDCGGRYAVNYARRKKPVYDIKNAGPNHCFCVISDHGPMRVHNCVQAVARDCLCEVIRRAAARGWDIVFHVHDEVIVDAPENVHTEDLCALMDEPIDWAPGLLLKGAGFEAEYYMKD